MQRHNNAACILPGVETVPVLNGMEFEYFYFGSLYPHETQFKSGRFVGLALNPEFPRDVAHNITKPLPFETGSMAGGQAQDVFEHLEYESVPRVLDEVHRCLKPGGLFRLSVPDYNSPLLRSRSAYDSNGRILCDLAMGGSLKGIMSGGIEIILAGGGTAHVWFPTYYTLLDRILKSDIRKSTNIVVQHAWIDSEKWVRHDFDQTTMPVLRSPPNDPRANGKPLSLIVDFIK